MMNVVRMGMEKTRCRDVCLAGGVALNSKANGKIAASGLLGKMFVQPAASDDGVALGAALAPYLDGNGKLPNRAMRHGYWGPSFDDEAIESALRTYKLRYTKAPDPASTAAELLSQGKILGWFKGRMEFGPREGVTVIMNTSFNLRGEAIVHTPTDAIRTFFSSGMDALAIGSYLVEK